jgi:N-acetylneuraminic acid mutarotase
MKKHITMTGAFTLLMVAQICLAQGSWTQIGDMPENRYGHTANELNGKIYIVGGANTETSIYPRTALVYDTSSTIWTHIPLRNNRIRAAHNSCVVGGRLYVIGGNDSSRTISTMDMFDPDLGQWVSKDSMTTDRGLAACASIGGRIYVMGGMQFIGASYDYAGMGTVEVYDTNTGTWTQLADMPTKRWGHSAVAVNGKIYVFGGRTSAQYYSSVEVYDPQTNAWTTRSTMPTFRYCLTACLLNNDIYAIGGWAHSGTGPLYDKVEAYHPESDQWYTETPMPVARAVHASIVLGGRIYVYGGSSTTHPLIGTSGIYAFDTKPLGPAYAHDVRLSRHGRDTLGITTRVENPPADSLNVEAILTTGSGVLIDSLLLADDGLHGDSSSADGLWGYLYVPKKDDTIHVTLCTNNLDAGTSRIIRDAAAILFTRGAQITYDPRLIDLGRISLSTSCYDTTFVVRNVGYAADSLTVSLDPGTVIPDTAVSAFPELFTLAPGDSQKVTFRIRPYLLSPQYYVAQVILEPKFAFGPRRLEKNFQFQMVVTGSVTDLAGFPTIYVLDQNYPNPFNPSTTIRYGLPHKSAVQLTVFNTLGQQVSILQNGEMEAGYHEVKFDGTGLSSGVYFYRLRTGGFVETKKLMLTK